MNNHPRRKRGLLTGLVAVATALTLAFSVAAPAQAAGPSTITQNTATLNVHKHKQPNALGTPATGLEIPGGLADPMAGITFTAVKVPGIDLKTNAGWATAGNTTVAGAQVLIAAAGPAAIVNTQTTLASGLAQFTALPLGLYLVTETVYGADVTPAVPFLVTLPITNPTNLDAWVYDVHVYPKNATTTATKTVADMGSVKLGDNVVWTITADIPKAPVIDKYTVVDVLAPQLTGQSVVISLTGNTGVTLVLEDDYTIVESPANTFTVTFTDTGREKLVTAWQADPTAQVRGVVTTKVIAIGEIANEATVFPNSTSSGVKTGEAITKWGNVVVKKAKSTDSSALAGAEFQVFLSEDDAIAKNNPITISPGTSDAKSTFTSGPDGLVLISGLRYSNWANGASVAKGDPGYQTYWIRETKAPAGYELLAQPIEVSVTNANTTVDTAQSTVLNVAKFALPLTGASGATTIIMLAGLLLLVVGTSAVVVSRRKRGQAKA